MTTDPIRVIDAVGSLPGPSPRRLAVRVTADALRQLRGGSPWLYDRSITAARAAGAEAIDAAPGDLAIVFDEDRRFAAIGLWDPDSPVRVKVLHTGAPATIAAAWWAGRVGAAIARRATLAADPDTDAYRLVHGENDGLGGLVVDRYGATLVVKLYSTIWWPHLAGVLDALVDQECPRRIVLRLARSVPPRPGLADGTTVAGPAPDGPVRFRERGLAFEADVVAGHKTGHFLDQRDNRALVRGMAAGARVLDVFACTGGFSVSAAAGGAASVHLVDASAPALAAAARNLALNRHIGAVRDCRVRTTVGDAFAVLRELGERVTAGASPVGRRRAGGGHDDGRYDLVVVDPPSFASSKAAVPAARRAYARLTQAVLPLVRPGGVLVQASCSSRIGGEELFGIVHDAAGRCGVKLREIRRTGHPLDHPIAFAEGAYLKALFATVE